MSEQLKSQEEFLANFNWHNFEEGIDAVDEKNLLEFEELVSKTFIATDQEEVVNIFRKYDLVVLPVLDDEKMLVLLNFSEETSSISLPEFSDFSHEVINNYKELVVDKSNVKLLPYQAVILKIK